MYTNDVFGCNFEMTRNGQKEMFNVVKYESRSNEYVLCEKKDLAAFWECPKILVAGKPEYMKEIAEEMSAP